MRWPHWYSFQNRVGEISARVEVAQVEREHLVEQLVRLGVVTCVDAVLRFAEEIRGRVVARRSYMRQPVRGAPASACAATCDIMGRILSLERERHQPEDGCVDADRRHLAREVGMPRVRPLLLRRHCDDRARDLVAHRRAERDLAG